MSPLPPCVVPTPSTVQSILPVVGTLAGAAVGALAAFATKSREFSRSDRGVRLQLTALLDLSREQMLDAMDAAESAVKTVPLTALPKAIERAFSSDATIALGKKAAAVYQYLIAADAARRQFDSLAEQLAKQQQRMLTDLPKDPAERAHLLELRRTHVAASAEKLRSAAQGSVQALDAAQLALGAPGRTSAGGRTGPARAAQTQETQP